jgi:N-acetylglucosaminyldiphosphoundecaprenol N-acetyl-beta-D-mannosaminyltransferase
VSRPVPQPASTSAEPVAGRFFENASAQSYDRARRHEWDDLSRDVYCVLGIPVDAIDMPSLLQSVEQAAAHKFPFLISTPNLNFLVTSQLDAEFRETVLNSDLCPADGMPIVWIARLIGLPIKERVAGSDMMEELRRKDHFARPLKLYLFGGTEAALAAAARAFNATAGGLRCVGTLFPGFGSVEDMSQDHIIDRINASDADFLIAALGAKKGQAWLHRNSDRLQIPVRSHLGAVVNFAAGNVRRAPPAIRKMGLEWAWRIKEEPHLWRRYWKDGTTLLKLLLTCVLPLAIRNRWQRLRQHQQESFAIERTEDHNSITLGICGPATAGNIERAKAVFRAAATTKGKIRISLSKTSTIDARFFGLLIMLRKVVKKQGGDVEIIGVPSRLRRTFRLNGAGFMLGWVRGGEA